MAIFKGAGVAIVTPMKENEEVNYDKLEELVEWQIEQGTDAIVIVGTTGESSTLTTEEHSDVIRAAVRFASIVFRSLPAPVPTAPERRFTFPKRRKRQEQTDFWL